ncbi:MAG: hypothetical protein ACE5FR_00455 [Rhodospirillales bacterium]
MRADERLAAGDMEGEAVWLLACVPGLAGMWVGQKIRGRIDQETFRKALLVTLFVIGLNLIRRAVF